MRFAHVSQLDRSRLCMYRRLSDTDDLVKADGDERIEQRTVDHLTASDLERISSGTRRGRSATTLSVQSRALIGSIVPSGSDRRTENATRDDRIQFEPVVHRKVLHDMGGPGLRRHPSTSMSSLPSRATTPTITDRPRVVDLSNPSSQLVHISRQNRACARSDVRSVIHEWG